MPTHCSCNGLDQCAAGVGVRVGCRGQRSPGSGGERGVALSHAVVLRNEERAERVFGLLAAAAGSGPVREAALALEQEEREHVALVKEWIANVSQPGADGAVDPDLSRYID
jgi:hypothetical protein